MNKHLLRCIAFLLIPCLLADPVCASGIHHAFSNPLPRSSRPASDCFSEQAIVAALVVALFHPHAFNTWVSAALQASIGAVAIGFAAYHSDESSGRKPPSRWRTIIEQLVPIFLMVAGLGLFAALLIYLDTAHSDFLARLASWGHAVGDFDLVAHLPDWHPSHRLVSSTTFVVRKMASLDVRGWAMVFFTGVFFPTVARSFVMEGPQLINLVGATAGMAALIAIAVNAGVGIGSVILYGTLASVGFVISFGLWSFDRPAFYYDEHHYARRTLTWAALALLLGIPTSLLWKGVRAPAVLSERPTTVAVPLLPARSLDVPLTPLPNLDHEQTEPPGDAALVPIPEPPFKLSDSIKGSNVSPPLPAEKPILPLPDVPSLFTNPVDAVGESMTQSFKPGQAVYTFSFSDADFGVVYFSSQKPAAFFSFKMQSGESGAIGGSLVPPDFKNTFLAFDLRRKKSRDGTFSVQVPNGSKDLTITFRAYKLKPLGTPKPASSLLGSAA